MIKKIKLYYVRNTSLKHNSHRPYSYSQFLFQNTIIIKKANKRIDIIKYKVNITLFKYTKLQRNEFIKIYKNLSLI